MNNNSFFESKCGIMNHITDVVMLKYRSDGQDKYGVVKIHLGQPDVKLGDSKKIRMEAKIAFRDQGFRYLV